MSIIVGLTGPTGAGKSSIGALARRLGFKVIDCDVVAREESKNQQMLSLLCEFFGDNIIKDGVLDRAALAKAAFSSAKGRDALNRITLPFIVKRIEQMIDGEPRVLLDAPTLFESGLSARCDIIISVLAPISLRRTRIIERDKLDAAAADRRLLAARDDEFFISQSDFVIINDGSEKELITKAEQILQNIITEVK